jgi:hypothetical protein
MIGRCTVIAWLLLLGVASALWADPFAEVPTGHWAYGACARLVSLGVLPADRATGFSGRPALTRFEFATALLAPLSEIDRALRASKSKPDAKARLDAAAASLAVNPRTSEVEVARAAADLARLGTFFSEELRSLSLDPADAVRSLALLSNSATVRTWRTETRARSLTSLPQDTPVGDDVRFPLGHGSVALDYSSGQKAPQILDYLAGSRSGAGLTASSLGAASAAFSDPLVSRLRAAYEYGLGPTVTVSLGHEEIARRGEGLFPLDAASLTSLGIGYQFARSASVKVSYSLLDYRNYVSDVAPVRERMAETSVSVEF